MNSSDIQELSEQFSKMGIDLAWNLFSNVIDKIKKQYPNIPDEEFRKIGLETFKECEFNVSVKTSASKSNVPDEKRCEQLLKSGKNKGNKCSLTKIEGSNYCKRHSKNIIKSQNNTKEQHNEISKFYNFIHTNSETPKTMKLRQYKEENIYLEAETDVVFKKDYEHDKYVAFGTHKKGSGIVNITKESIQICEKNGWEYEK